MNPAAGMAVLKAIEDGGTWRPTRLRDAGGFPFASWFPDQLHIQLRPYSAPTYPQKLFLVTRAEEYGPGLGQMLDNISGLTVIARTWTRIMTGMTSL